MHPTLLSEVQDALSMIGKVSVCLRHVEARLKAETVEYSPRPIETDGNQFNNQFNNATMRASTNHLGIRWTADDYTTPINANISSPQSLFAIANKRNNAISGSRLAMSVNLSRNTSRHAINHKTRESPENEKGDRSYAQLSNVHITTAGGAPSHFDSKSPQLPSRRLSLKHDAALATPSVNREPSASKKLALKSSIRKKPSSHQPSQIPTKTDISNNAEPITRNAMSPFIFKRTLDKVLSSSSLEVNDSSSSTSINISLEGPPVILVQPTSLNDNYSSDDVSDSEISLNLHSLQNIKSENISHAESNSQGAESSKISTTSKLPITPSPPKHPIGHMTPKRQPLKTVEDNEEKSESLRSFDSFIHRIKSTSFIDTSRRQTIRDALQKKARKDARESIKQGGESRPQSFFSTLSKRISGTLRSSKQRTLPESNGFRSFITDFVILGFLLPMYDGKGRKIGLEHFEPVDIQNLSFFQNGLHPRSIMNTLWELFLIGLYVSYMWLIPFVVAFQPPTLDIEYLSIVITVTYVLDTVVTLLAPQPKISDGVYTLREYESLRPVLKEWIKEWIGFPLIFEVITLIPFEIIFSQWEHGPLLLLIRLARLCHRIPIISSHCAILIQWSNILDAVSGFGVSQITPIAIGMVLFLHFNACSIYFFGRLTGFVGWSDKWTEFEDADLFDFYAWTLYRAVGNMFPAAFDPQTPIEQLIQTIYVIISAVIYAVFLGAISSATMSINPSGKLYQHKMEQLNDYVKWKNLSTETELKLFSYYETKYRGKFFEEESLLSEMNESLRAEISLQNTRALLERVPFLKRQYGDGRDEIFLGRLAMALRPQYYVTGDYITKQGDSGHDMFFILHGKVDVSVNGKKMVSLFDGAYIGEVALITNVPRTATVQAAMPSILYRLNYNDFHDILDEFLDMKMRIEALANEREAALNLVKAATMAHPVESPRSSVGSF
ncbi:hypothetical protein HDU79_011534 [Rhizoclosmatium sp. JEL0117]|nr:hypothetical protein HDU79_011534 [Rhizoclosmatium sp. JEL0117]